MIDMLLNVFLWVMGVLNSFVNSVVNLVVLGVVILMWLKCMFLVCWV